MLKCGLYKYKHSVFGFMHGSEILIPSLLFMSLLFMSHAEWILSVAEHMNKLYRDHSFCYNITKQKENKIILSWNSSWNTIIYYLLYM